MNYENLKSREELIEELQSLEDRSSAKISESGQTIRSELNKQSDNIEQLNLVKRLRFKIQNLKALVIDTTEDSWGQLGDKMNEDFGEILQEWAKIHPIKR